MKHSNGRWMDKTTSKRCCFKNVCVAIKEDENLTFLRETLLFDDNWCITSISQTKIFCTQRTQIVII